MADTTQEMDRSAVLSRNGQRMMHAELLAPEPTYVRQLPPQGRRSQRRNRDAIEKSMLRARNSNFERHGEEIENPFLIERGTPSFMSDADRYHTNVAGEARLQRQAARERRDLAHEHLRMERLERDDRRWQKMDSQVRSQEGYLHQLRKTGMKTRKNISGAAFNPITLKINEDGNGAALREMDLMVRQRAMHRTIKMASRSNSTYDPITGADYNFAARPALQC
jgi:hypothetical protein